MIQINAENSFDKVHHSFMIKTPTKLQIEGELPHLIKSIYDESTSNIILNVLEILVSAVRQEIKKAYRLERKKYTVLICR